MSQSRTLKWWPLTATGRRRGNALRRRRVARRTTPLWVEHLECRSLLAALPAPDLVSWYRAEGNALDFADGNNGSLVGGATFAAGKVGQAFSFDGMDDLVSVPNSANLDLQQSLTLDAWVNPSASNSLPGGTVIVGRPFGYQLDFLPNGHVALGFPSAGNAAVNQVVESSSSIPLNAFTHVAATFDSATGQANIYVNGVLENTTVAVGPINSMVKPLQIGGFDDPGFTGGFFQGLIDEVDVFDRALSPSEIQSIVSAGSEGKATIVVDTTADSVDALDGATSLREAISESNTTPARDTIGFSVPRPSTSDLVSWWRAEGNTNDSAGANAGTLQNGATFAPGRYGQAFSLDGTDDFVQFPDAENLDGMAQLTVDAWVKFNALPNGKEQFILSKAEAVGVGSNSYAFWLQGATMRLTAAVETTSGLTTLQAPEAFTDTTNFHHLALTYDGLTARFFVDGVLKSSSALSGSVLNTTYPVLIGRRSGPGVDGNGDAFNGLVDEAGISNRALSDAEIQAIASGSRTISPSSALPAITDPVIIDGYTQPGASANTLANGNNAVLKVGLDGANAGSANGLLIAGDGSTVRGLAIGNFSGDGIHLASSDNVVAGNFIGTDVTGTIDHGNGGDGVAIANSAAAQTIYSNDFESSVGSEWSTTTTDVTPVGNRHFLGQFGSETTTLTLPAANIPTGTAAVTLSFDLFVIRTWDGNDTGSGSGPDRWSLTLGNGMALLDTTFSNNHPNSGFAGQAYPGVFGSGQFAPQTGASEINTLGFLSGNDEFDSVYHLSFTFSYTGGDLVLRFAGALTTPGLDESWGLDNVQITSTANAFSAPNDFSLASNPNGAWTYGYTSSLGGTLHTYPDSSTHPSGLQAWIDNSIQSLGAPSVAYNPAASPTGDCCTVQPGQLAFHPGPNGEQSVVRWTAPADDTVKLAASFVGIDGSPTTTDPHVLHNGVSIFDGTVNRLHAGPYFETTLTVHAGDTIDFAIGNGGNGFFSDSSALDAVITSTSGGTASGGATQNNTVGGLAPAQQNLIAYNRTGVSIVGNSTGNPILANSIFANDGLGIDLGNDGVTPNDPGDADSGSNHLQNTPIIATLTSTPLALSVTGSLDATPSSDYRIEFFASDTADPSGSGEGRRLLGALQVTTDVSGHAAIQGDLPPIADGQWITTTATLLIAPGDSPGETSEFSPAVQAHLEVILPTIRFTATHYDVTEGQDFAVLTVERTGGIGTAASVDFTTTDGTAGQRQIRSGSLRAEDYTTTSGTLVFRRGIRSREIQVPIRDDSIIEPNELFHVVLSNPSTGLTLGDNSTADVTIHDNDPSVRFVASSSKRGESATGRSQIQVQLTPASNQTVTVAYAAVGGTATANQDFRPSGGTITFHP
jgi:hypothetical protein